MYALLILTFVGYATLALAKPDSHWCTRSLETLNPHGFALGIGDTVLLTHGGKTEPVATFLGERGDFHFYLVSQTGRVIAVHRTKVLALHDELAARLEAAAPTRRIQTMLQIACQSGSDCAVHSTRNGLLALRDLGLLPKSLESELTADPEGFLARLAQTEINAETQRRLKLSSPNTPPQLQDQTTHRQNYLEQQGVSAAVTRSPLALQAHLLAGKPAILDLAVLADDAVGFDLVAGEISHPIRGKGHLPDVAARTKPFAEKKFHSVLGLTAFRDPETGEVQVLVLDSATGSFHVWGLKAILPALDDYGATLLDQKKPQEIPQLQQRRRAS